MPVCDKWLADSILSYYNLQNFIAVGEIDPLNRRHSTDKRPDVVVQGTYTVFPHSMLLCCQRCICITWKYQVTHFFGMPSTYCHSSSSKVVLLYTGIHLSLTKDQMMHFMVWTFCFGSSSQNLSLKRAKEIYCCLVLLF